MLPPGVTPSRSISSRNLPDVESDAARKRNKCIHAIFLILMVLSYGFSLTMIDGDRILLSGAWREILQELHPDEPKDAERLIEGEVVPKWGEVLHADDVSKQLNWFQTFCRNKYGMDDHLEFYWKCNIFSSELQWDDSKPALDTHMNCSNAFIDRHIRRGDNPLCVPYGADSLSHLQKLVIADGNGPTSVGDVDEIYDEYTIREGSPMFEFLDEAFEGVDAELDEIEHILAKGSSEEKRRLQTLGVPSLQPLCQSKKKGCKYPHLTVKESNVPCHCFVIRGNKTIVLRTCKNHHWGLFLLCQPESLAVKFFIERIKPRRLTAETLSEPEHERRLFWFSVTMEFTKLQGVIDETAGWYRTNLVLEEGEFYGYKTILEGIIGLFAGVLILVILIRELVWTVVLLPRNARHLLGLRNIHAVNAHLAQQHGRDPGDITITANDLAVLFEKRLMKVCDGRGQRRKYMSMIECLMENIAAICAVMGIIGSITNFTLGQIPSAKYEALRYTPAQYIMHRISGEQKLIELVYEILFDNTSWHGFAWFVLYFRTLGLFLNSVNGTKWLPMTILLAWIRSFYFLVFFGFLLTGFAVLAYIQFGQRFLQFSTVSRSVLELSFLTCGVPSAVFDDMYPFQERTALLACTYLAVFLILAVTIGMNFFTTILLDAYNIALDPSAAEEILCQSWATILKGMMKSIGVPLEECAASPGDDSCSDVDESRDADDENVSKQIELVTRSGVDNFSDKGSES